MAKKKQTRPPKVKQGFIDPEMEPVTIKELDHAAENYYDTVQDRLPYTAAEAEAKEAVTNLMKKHSLGRYEFNGFVVTCTDTANVAVKKKKQKKAVGDDPNEHAPDAEGND